jgi:DNA polymerase V
MRFPATVTNPLRHDTSMSAYINPSSATTFCFRMEGESMINAHIPDGALVIADRSVKPQSGMIVVAAVNGEYTVRRLVQTRKLLVLHADNPSFRPMPVTADMQLEVHGVVTAIIITVSGFGFGVSGS